MSLSLKVSILFDTNIEMIDWEDTLSINAFPWYHITRQLNKYKKKFNVEEVYDMYRRQIHTKQVSLYKFDCKHRNSISTLSSKNR